MMRTSIILGVLMLVLGALLVVLAITGQSRACPGLTSPPVAGCPHLYGSVG